MGLSVNYEANQSAKANTQAITYTSVASAGGTAVAVADAGVYYSPIAEGAPSAGVYTKVRARFSIRNSLIGSLSPKPADTITTPDGAVWTVLTARKPIVSGVWQLEAIDLALSNGLAQTGTLTRPSNTQDAAGRPARNTYSTIASGVACRVQPMGGDAADFMSRRGMPSKFTAYLAIQIVPQSTDVFASGGQSYTVLGFKNPQRIDELMLLNLELLEGGTAFPINSVLPSIAGSNAVGSTLTASHGTWSASPTFTYRWLSGGVPIAGATSSTYATQSSDLGNLISVVVTAAAAAGTTSATSLTVGPIVQGGSGSSPGRMFPPSW